MHFLSGSFILFFFILWSQSLTVYLRLSSLLFYLYTITFSPRSQRQCPFKIWTRSSSHRSPHTRVSSAWNRHRPGRASALRTAWGSPPWKRARAEIPASSRVRLTLKTPQFRSICRLRWRHLAVLAGPRGKRWNNEVC